MPSALLFHVEHRAPQLERYYEAGCRPFPEVIDARSLHLRAAQHAESMGKPSSFLLCVASIESQIMLSVCGCST